MKFKPLFLPFVAAELLFTGCATFHPKPLAPQKSAAAFEARTLTAPELHAFIESALGHVVAWPPQTWDFPLLTLAALYYHPDLDVARAQWSVTQAAQITAGERPNPTLNLPEEYASNAAAGVSPWILGLALDIPVETAGKRGYRIQQSKALSEAARLHIARVAWQVRSHLRASFLALYAAQRSEEILQVQQTKLTENKRLFEKRSAGGLASPLALTQAEVLAGKTDVALEEATRQKQAARGQLADALGLSIRALEGTAPSVDGLDHPTFMDAAALTPLRDQALQNRSDLLESLAAYAASQAALQLEVAKQFPDIHLGPGFLFDQGTHKWGFGGSVALPVFSRNRGPIAEATARRDEAAARFLALQDQVIGEIDRALADYQATRRKFEAAGTLLTMHLKQDQALQRLLHPGDLSRLTLFRAQLDVDSTRLLASDALVQFYQAQGILEDALERPLAAANAAATNAENNPRAAEMGR